jgi:hypothetical protein
VLLHSSTTNDSPRVVWLEENILLVVIWGSLCNFVYHISSLAFLQLWELEDEVPFCPPVAACLHRCSIALSQAFLVQVSAEWGGCLQWAPTWRNCW